MWHVAYAYRHLATRGLVAYLGSRLAVAIFYTALVGGAAPVASSDGVQTYVVHVHHYLIGWYCASWAQFNRRASVLLLAGGAAVLAQARRALAYPNKP